MSTGVLASNDAARLVDELTTLLYEVTTGWDDSAGGRQIVRCGACRRRADRAESVVHDRDCPVYRLIRAEEVNTAVIRANAEEIADLEDKRDDLEAKVNALTAERDESVLNMTQTAEAFARLKVKSEAWEDDSKRLHNEYLPTIRIIDELLEIKDQAIQQAWAERDAALARAEAALRVGALVEMVPTLLTKWIGREDPPGLERWWCRECGYHWWDGEAEAHANACIVGKARAALAAAAPGEG